MWEGGKLKEIVKEKGLSVSGFAKHLGVSRQAVNDWINGTVPSGLHLVRISQLLSTPPDFFFSMETGNLSMPLHRKRGAAKVKEKYEKASLELAGEYENMFRNAPSPGLEPSLRIMPHEKQAQMVLAQQLRKLSGIESHKPMDYQSLFKLLVQLRIVTVFRKFPLEIKGYAFYCRIHNHRVIFVNTATNVLDLIFPVLHEVIHAIRSTNNERATYDEEEEDFCDTVAGLIQFPQEYVNMVITALKRKTNAVKINKLKELASNYGHSLYGIAKAIEESGSQVMSGIKVFGANENLKKEFQTLEEVLFEPPEPRRYIEKLQALTPIFIDIVKGQLDVASRRKIGEWLGLENLIDAKDAIRELSHLTQLEV